MGFRRQQPVHSIELNGELCRQGQLLADKHQLSHTFTQLDALTPAATKHLQPAQHAVALHACGELHLQLIKQAGSRRTHQVSISPCCYHLIQDRYYRPLSKAAKEHPLKLSHHDLRLPLQETVTAPKRLDPLRIQEVSWRLGFDLLQRQVRERDEYLNTPNIPKTLLRGSFKDYCLWVADRKQLSLPVDTDFDHYQRSGEQRYPLIKKIELVRHLYRRPLELWLVLDRALYLQEQGYQVTINEFCDRRLTPRNILINAKLAT